MINKLATSGKSKHVHKLSYREDLTAIFAIVSLIKFPVSDNSELVEATKKIIVTLFLSLAKLYL